MTDKDDLEKKLEAMLNELFEDLDQVLSLTVHKV